MTQSGYQFEPNVVWIEGRDTTLDFRAVPITSLRGFSVTATPSVVTAGDSLTVSWVAPNGRDCRGGGDWIALYRVGDPDNTGAFNGHSDLWYTHLCGATAGTSKLPAPGEPGQYEFRYMIGDVAVTRSEPLTVAAGT